jgi:hypothetical protein
MPKSKPDHQPIRDEMLALEYRECNVGYNTRDALVQDQFYKMVQTLSIFVTVMLAFRLLIETTLLLHLLFIFLIAITGLLALVAIFSDLESNASCKIALRKHILHIEEQLFTNNESGLWRSLETRERYPEERIIKKLIRKRAPDRDKHEPEKGVFVVAARLLIVAWIVIVITVSLI